MVTDADGAVIADAAADADHRGSPPAAVADLGFERLREQGGPTPSFGSVYRSPRTGRTVIPVSLRLERLDGSFSGIVTTTIETKLFLDFFNTFNLGRDGAVALWRDDGGLLVRQSLAGTLAGRTDGASNSLPYLFPSPPSGTFDLVSPIDHVARVLS